MYFVEKYPKTFTSLADFCITDGLLPGFHTQDGSTKGILKGFTRALY
jgi:hypothetical protein